MLSALRDVDEAEEEIKVVPPGSARDDELDANFPLIVFHQWVCKFSRNPEHLISAQ